MYFLIYEYYDNIIIMKYSLKGFTLIELLVVISIISLLSSAVLVALSSTRLRAYDTKRIADMRSITTALALFYSQKNRYPYNYNHNNYGHGQLVDPLNPNDQPADTGACDAAVPNVPGADPTMAGYIGIDNNILKTAYTASMQELVDAGDLGSVPYSQPGGPGYCYNDFGPTGYGGIGAVMMTEFQTMSVSSCRSPQGDSGWCGPTAVSKEYCTCSPH